MTTTSEFYILIDDDSLVHMMWKMVAKSKQINLKCYFNETEFQNAITDVPKTAKVYVDKNLGAGVNGLEVAQRVYELGYSQIYLATGDDHILNGIQKTYPFLKGVIGKEPPF